MRIITAKRPWRIENKQTNNWIESDKFHRNCFFTFSKVYWFDCNNGIYNSLGLWWY